MLKISVFFTFFLLCAYASELQPVRTIDTTALTFKKGEFTTSRVGRSVPQLEYVDVSTFKWPECFFYNQPETIECRRTNAFMGWDCAVDLRYGYEAVAQPYIVCESWDEDGGMIVEGSCALQYYMKRASFWPVFALHHICGIVLLLSSFVEVTLITLGVFEVHHKYLVEKP